jgi:heme oxygenase (biliverdin-IX-beta and delta-forming)
MSAPVDHSSVLKPDLKKRADNEPGDVRSYLCAATRAAHGRLDSHPLMLGLLRGEADLNCYPRLLRRYAQLYQELEGALDREQECLPAGIDWPSRRKLPWLREDLRYFGCAENMDEATHMPPRSAGGTTAAALGLLYPLEGATLGGLAIKARLRRSLNIDTASGGRFFAGYGAQTVPRWNVTCAALETIAEDEGAREVAARQALWVFERFELALNRAAAD